MLCASSRYSRIVTGRAVLSTLFGLYHFCKSSLLMADIRPGFPKGFKPKSCRILQSKSSNGSDRAKGRASAARWVVERTFRVGLIAAACWPRFRNLARTRSLFSTSLDSLSCSEKLCLVDELFGPTLRVNLSKVYRESGQIIKLFGF